MGIVVDVTEQRHHLRMQEARLKFSERVRDMTDTAEIAALAARVIGEAPHVRRVGLCDIVRDGKAIDVRAEWTAPGQPSLVGADKNADFAVFASALKAGETVVMTDARTDPRAAGQTPPGVDALANLPLMAGGRLEAALFVNAAEVRDWAESELGFMHAMLERACTAIDRLRSEAKCDVLERGSRTG